MTASSIWTENRFRTFTFRFSSHGIEDQAVHAGELYKFLEPEDGHVDFATLTGTVAVMVGLDNILANLMPRHRSVARVISSAQTAPGSSPSSSQL